MKLGKYGIEIKEYLEKYKPLMFQELVINGNIMDYLQERENEINKFSILVEEQLKEKNPMPKTNEFIIAARYNIQIETMVDEFIKEKIYNL